MKPKKEFLLNLLLLMMMIIALQIFIRVARVIMENGILENRIFNGNRIMVMVQPVFIVTESMFLVGVLTSLTSKFAEVF